MQRCISAFATLREVLFSSVTIVSYVVSANVMKDSRDQQILSKYMQVV